MSLKLKYLLITVVLISTVVSMSAQNSEHFAQNGTSYTESKANEVVEKEIDIPRYLGDKIYWYDSLRLIRQNLNLEDLEKSQTPTHIRIWTDKSAIDAWQDEEEKYHCYITSFCKDYDEKKEIEGDFSLKRNRVESISGQILIDSIFSKKVTQFDDYLHIKKINKNLIDGITYKIEISTPTKYRMFTLLNPENQSPFIKEIETFLSYLDIMKMEFDLDHFHRQFMMGLKNGTYVAGLEVITKKKNSAILSRR